MTSFALTIFDCDGVLVDSEPIANRILARALKREGLVVADAEVDRATRGLAMGAVLAWAEAELGRPLAPDFLARVQAETFAAFRRELKPVPGVEEALDALAMPCCVASSGEPEKIRLSLTLTGLIARFDGNLFSAVEVARGKPCPDLFLHAARVMGAPPELCAVVEDSLPGVLAARAAGMTVFAYAPHDPRHALAGAGATVFERMAGLPALLSRSPA